MTIKLTPDQLHLQRLNDEQTVFALAVLMMELHVGTLMRNKAKVANAFMKAGVVIRNNEGFPERFKDAQTEIIKQLQTPTVSPLVDNQALHVISPAEEPM